MITVIASGKGGVGKSTVTANVSAALSKRGKKVLSIDADIGMRNLDLILGIQDICMWDSGDAFMDRCTFEQAVTVHERFPNLSLLPAPSVTVKKSGISEYLAAKAIEFDKSGTYDHIIIDCPSGISNEVTSFFFRGVRLILIATPDITSIRDSQKVIREARERGVTESGIIVNRVRPKSIEKGLSPDIDYIMDSVAVRLSGLIPEDRRTSELSFAGVLSIEKDKSLSRKAYENIAARLDGEYKELYKFWK